MFDGYTGFILGAIFTFITGFAINLTTPYLQPYLDRYVNRYWESRRLRSEKRKQKIEDIIKQMESDQDLFIDIRFKLHLRSIYLVLLMLIALLIISIGAMQNTNKPIQGFTMGIATAFILNTFMVNYIYADHSIAMRTYLHRKREKYNQNKD